MYKRRQWKERESNNWNEWMKRRLRNEMIGEDNDRRKEKTNERKWEDNDRREK